MIIDDKIRINILESEWREFPKEKQEKLKLLLTEINMDITQIINLDEGDSDGRD